MSFYSYKNANAECSPGVVNGNILTGLNQRVCIQVKNVYDSALSQEQLEAIRRLREAGLLDQLPDKLQQTAAARLAHPELTLSELAESLDPPVTKSCLNHRLRKIQQLAKGL